MRRAVLLLLLCAVAAVSSSAQTFTKLHDFQGSSEGSKPFGSLVQGADGSLYGEATENGTFRRGTIFKITPEGALTTVHSFIGGYFDASGPYGGLTLAPDGNFYGTSVVGGTYDDGTVFKMTPAGTVTVLHSFCPLSTCTGGAEPMAGLALGKDGNFYGTTHVGNGNVYLNGTIFKITPEGALTDLHQFAGADGSNSTARLLQASDGNFYGTTQQGGYVRDFRCPQGCGTIFRITPQGVLTTLHYFCSQDSSCADGYFPYDGFVQGTDGALYGVAAWGGLTGAGTIFKMELTGTLTTLYSFTGTQSWQPAGEMIEAADAFYGMTADTIYRITPGGDFSVLHQFCPQWPCTNGSMASGALTIGKDGLLYGATVYGGTKNLGTIFRIDLGLAPLSLTKSGNGAGTVLGTDGHINCGSTCSYAYSKGKQLQLSAIPGPGSTFSGWTGCDQVQGSYCAVTLNRPRNVNAAFTNSSVTLKSLVLKPSTVRGGQLSAGTITLSAPAPDGGLGVSIASSVPNAAHPPSSIVVPAGRTTAGFAVRTFPVKKNTTVNISASTGTSQVSAPLTVTTGFGSQQLATGN